MKGLLIGVLLIACSTIKAQHTGQIDTVGKHTTSSNIYVKQLGGDSLSGCFVIVIKQGVKLHKHLYHSETVTIIEGEGTMRLGEKSFKIKQGDVIFIPRNTPHAATSTGNIPLKVISVQSPQFDGTDRVFLE